jgi:hypothetical protein
VIGGIERRGDSLSGYEHHRVLIMIETAQRAGRTEKEIVQLVAEQLGDGAGDVRIEDEHRLVRRLLGRSKLPKAA